MAAGGRAVVAVLLAVLGLASAPAAAGQGLRDQGGLAPDLAKVLLDEARQAGGIGDWESAAAYLDEAASQDPGNADVRYLRALASVKRGQPLGLALDDLDAALATRRHAYYRERDVLLLKAELLVRERRWKEALAALVPPWNDSNADPAYRLIRARALLGSGDRKAFVGELASALNRFPDDPAFARLFLAKVGKLPSSAEESGLARIILGRLARYAQSDAEIPVLAAPLMGELEARRDAVAAFRAAGGSSASATLRAIEYGLIDEGTATAELLSGGYPLLLGDISSLYALAGSPAGRESVFASLAAWSGRVTVDADGDGNTEGFFTLAAGRVTRWEADSGQRQEADAQVTFSDGLPAEARLSRRGLEIRVIYSAYPAAETVSFDDGSETRSYSFGPEALAFAPLEMRLFAGKGRTALFFPYAAGAPDPSERGCAAVALSVATESGAVRGVTLLDKGRPISATTYVDGRLYSSTTFSKGAPVLERIDADGDGRFETEKSYATDDAGTNSLAWTRSDADGDGVFEYREQAVFPFLKEWDYDGNGSVDARQFSLADGAVEQEFSSRLDGRFDETIIVKNGSIVALSRSGRALALLPDSNAGLRWIGKKPFDLGRNLPAGDGVFSMMGTRYRITRVGEQTFAELIP